MTQATRQNALIFMAWILVIACASLQVAATHWHRQLVGVWQVTEHERLALEQDYGRLLLEQSALTAHGRVERIARDKLKMMDAQDVQVIRHNY